MDFSTITDLLSNYTFLLTAIGIGSFIAVFGMGRALTDKGAAAERMAPKQRFSAKGPVNAFADANGENGGFAEALVPNDKDERFAITIALAKAGFRGKGAVAGFYATRLGLAVVLPGILVFLVAYARMPGASGAIADALSAISTLGLAQFACILCAIGFFAPTMWLRGKQ